MRNLPARPAIPEPTQKMLAEKTKEILGIPAGEARRRRGRAIFDHSRNTLWFAPVKQALRGIAGHGELCMYCSANEPSQVEHYRPVAVWPEEAMKYENYLWTCGICNSNHKRDRFPPDTEPGERILNPLEDNVWAHFFLHERFGRLMKRVDPVTEFPLPRAQSTCSVVGVDRENLQFRRERRFTCLRRDAERTLTDFETGVLTAAETRERLAEWRTDPFQADVTDYFLNGPGRSKEPFRSLLLEVGEAVR